MSQAGVNSVILYEKNNINYFFHDEDDLNSISGITTSGETITIENKQRIGFDHSLARNENNKLGIVYQLKWFEFDLTIDTIEQIETIKESIYGWCPLITFYDGTTKFYDVPLFCQEESEIDIQESMAISMQIINVVPTRQKHYNYFTAAELGFKADTTLITADSTLYTADYEF